MPKAPAGGLRIRVFTDAQFKRYNMAKSTNKVILVGNVGKDPGVKYTPNGVSLAKFSLATNERFKDKSGECRIGPSGTMSSPGSTWPKLSASTFKRVRSSISKASCKAQPGKTGTAA